MIDYLREENRALREQLGGRRVRQGANGCATPTLGITAGLVTCRKCKRSNSLKAAQDRLPGNPWRPIVAETVEKQTRKGKRYTCK